MTPLEVVGAIAIAVVIVLAALFAAGVLTIEVEGPDQ